MGKLKLPFELDANAGEYVVDASKVRCGEGALNDAIGYATRSKAGMVYPSDDKLNIGSGGELGINLAQLNTEIANNSNDFEVTLAGGLRLSDQGLLTNYVEKEQGKEVVRISADDCVLARDRTVRIGNATNYNDVITNYIAFDQDEITIHAEYGVIVDEESSFHCYDSDGGSHNVGNELRDLSASNARTSVATAVPTNGTLLANVMYNLGTLAADLTFNIGNNTTTSGGVTTQNIYALQFAMGATAYTVTLPTTCSIGGEVRTIKWVGGAPTFQANKTYEINIMNGIGCCIECDTPSAQQQGVSGEAGGSTSGAVSGGPTDYDQPAPEL